MDLTNTIEGVGFFRNVFSVVQPSSHTEINIREAFLNGNNPSSMKGRER
jgi:hypothetical protein